MRTSDLIIYLWMVAQIFVVVTFGVTAAYVLTMLVLNVWAIINTATS